MTFLFFGAKSLKATFPTFPLEKLTHENHAAILNATRNIEGGRENPFRTGDNTPQIKAVFLRPSFLEQCNFASFKFIMMVLFGQSLGLVAPVRGILTPFNTVTNTVRSMRDGFPQNLGKFSMMINNLRLFYV
jgi:hypothetical protein